MVENRSGAGAFIGLQAVANAPADAQTIGLAPDRGGAPALLDVMAGHLDLYFSLITESMPHVEAGKMRPLVLASATRKPALPDVPPLAESWPGFTGTADYGLVGASGLSPAWVDFWNRAMTDALARPAVQDRLRRLRAEPTGGAPADYAAKLRGERAVWGRVVREAGIRVET